MTLLDPQSEWARLLLGSFADAGVRHVVVSPGSRSTPFALAAAGEARLQVHSVIDERAAAFFALGQARATSVPSLLLCTSGSAPAHYLPAVIEARHAHVPLLVLTADRPLEAMAAGAHQTIDQTRLFGDQVRGFFELGGVDAAPSALRGIRRLVAQATALAHDGPVHLNVRARKPLEPAPASELEVDTSTRIRAAASQPVPHFDPPLARSTARLDSLRARIFEEERGIIAVGPLPRADDALTDALVALSERTGYPLVVEPTSQLRGLQAGLLSTVFAGERTRVALQPRVILQIGPPPVAASYERLVAAAAHLEIFAAWPEVDADSRARAIHVGDLVELVRALVLPPMQRGDYARRVLSASERASRAVSLRADDELAAVRAVVKGVQHRRPTLFVGNSLPVRELALASSLVDGPSPISHHQRGASGIDGLCAGAAGLASVAGPTVVLLGDVSLLHDMHGLFVAGQITTPLVVAVIANGGGRIFDQLPVGRRADLATSMPLFTTPVTPDLATLARFCGARFVRTTDATHIAAALDGALDHAGCTLLEMVVAPGSAADLAARLPALVDEACES